MSSFRFDDCIFSRRLKAQCDKQGLAAAERLPKRLAGQEDAGILRATIADGHVLVTADRHMAEQKAAALAGGHPGLIIVASAERTRCLTDAIVRKTLGTLKTLFPGWHTTNLRNSVVEVTQHSVWVWHAQGERLVCDDHMALERTDLPRVLAQVLQRNALGPASCPLPSRNR